MGKLISYIRVSTQRQGASGLDLEAQRGAVASYAQLAGHEVISEVQEIESGRRSDRPGLTRAIALARVHNAVLCVARLDRLARDLHFISKLMHDKVRFLCCDNPNMNEMTVGIMASVAPYEAKCISERTRVALAAAKARGVQLGGSRSHAFTHEERARGAKRGGATRALEARERALALAPILDELRRAGIATLQAMADALNERAIPTACGGRWYAMTVRNVNRTIVEARQ